MIQLPATQSSKAKLCQCSVAHSSVHDSATCNSSLQGQAGPLLCCTQFSDVGVRGWRPVIQQPVRSLRCFGPVPDKQRFSMQQHPLSPQISRRLCSSVIPSSQITNSRGVLDTVSAEISSGLGRLFAVVQVSGLQHKVTTGDLILLQRHIPADVGERIRLEKVLLLGGDNFTLIGQPILSRDTVRVEATVIEKTTSQKKVIFKFKRRKRVAKYKEVYTDLTVLRINSIDVSPELR